MKTVTASVARYFDFTDSIAALNDERAANDLPPLTDEEIRDYVSDDLATSDRQLSDPFGPAPEIVITDE